MPTTRMTVAEVLMDTAEELCEGIYNKNNVG